MLVLSRNENESVVIRVGGEVITVTVMNIRGRKVRIGFEAACYVQINREEIDKEIHKENPK